MNIQTFIEKEELQRLTRKSTQLDRNAVTVLTDSMDPVLWSDLLSKNGYYYVDLANSTHWSTIHSWCNSNFGMDHYAWTGSRFWFETHENAVLFALRWA